MVSKSGKTLNQAEIEQATGLSREVLRKWELRFEFPKPLRDARGQRLYTPQDVRKLQHIQRLLARGHKPRNLLPLPLKTLQALLDSGLSPSGEALLDSQSLAPELLHTLAAGQAPDAVDTFLLLRLQQVGLSHFVQYDMPALNEAVGEAWMEGRLGIHGEHRYTQAVDHMVQRCVADLRPIPNGSRVLLTTPPGEPHGLGLLALQASLALRGAQCVNLGTQTPATSVAEAVTSWNIALVCLSASAGFPPKALGTYLCTLRKQLPPACEVWLGGGGVAAMEQDPIIGVMRFPNLQAAMERWMVLAQGSSNLY